MKDSKGYNLALEVKGISIYLIKPIQNKWKDPQRHHNLIKKILLHFILKWSKAKDMNPVKIYKELTHQNANLIFRKTSTRIFRPILTEESINYMIKSYCLKWTKSQLNKSKKNLSKYIKSLKYRLNHSNRLQKSMRVSRV